MREKESEKVSRKEREGERECAEGELGQKSYMSWMLYKGDVLECEKDAVAQVCLPISV